MPLSLIKELAKIVKEGRAEVQKILERINSGNALALQTNELVLPSKDVSGLYRGEIPSVDENEEWKNRLIYGDNILVMQGLLAGDSASGLESMRANFSLDLQKTIYEKTSYPSNKGGFEKAFLEFLDIDSKVLKFIKILEFKHDFATISYFRDDGLMASYYPDFMIETQKNIYLVETKSDKDLKDTNVKQKQKSTLDFVKRINNLNEDLREFKTWSYLLLGETQFYSLVKSGADIEDLANSSKMNELVFTRNLFDI